MVLTLSLTAVDFGVIIVHDILFCALLYEIIIQFRVLCHRLQNIPANVLKEVKVLQRRHNKGRKRRARERRLREGAGNCVIIDMESKYEAAFDKKKKMFSNFKTNALLGQCVKTHLSLIR